MIDKEKTCTACSGSGYYCGRNCGACNGTGLEYSKDDIIEALESELEKLQNKSSNSDYKMCSHVVDLICDVLLIEKSENMEINLHTIYSEAVEIKRLIRELREKFS